MKKQIWIRLVSLSMAMLMACGNNNADEIEPQASEAEIFEATESQAGPATYGINKTSLGDNTGSGDDSMSPENGSKDSEYEISDMLPAKDEMFVISLEEAEAIMNKNANKNADAEVQELNETEEAAGSSLVVYFSRADNMFFEEEVDAVTSASVIRNESGNPVLDESGKPIGNMRLLAEYVREETGSEIFSIRTVETYPTGDLDGTDLSAVEKNEDARPALSTHVENMDEYDVIYLGYPVCWETLPMPVASFLEEYDFAGKTIIPFASHDGSGFGSGVSMIKELCPEAEVLDGFAIRDSKINTDETKQKVAEFIAGL